MIVCAALYIISESTIICGLRHSDCYSTLYSLNNELYKRAGKEGLFIEGFITTENNFLDRTQAYLHAINCGQISAQLRHDKSLKRENLLYSEDLY